MLNLEAQTCVRTLLYLAVRAGSSGAWKRVLVVVAVAAASLWAIYPPDEKIKLGLDLNGGVQLVLRVKPGTGNDTRSDTVQQALHIIERRVNELGVAEPVVARYTAEDQILVQLPGVADVDRAKQIIKSTAQLRLTLVERGPFPDREAALQSYDNSLPPDLEVLPGPIDSDGAGRSVFYVVRRTPVVAGTDLRDARQSLDEFNRPAVAFTLKPDAGRRFGAFTERHLNRSLATVLDNRVTSVATILARIEDQGQITGISREEMAEQVITFKSGALPADLEYVEERSVGASLGEASIRSGVLASVGGLTLVVAFMLAYYRLAGLNALISILLNLLILVALVAFIPVTMTLPGIAGLILTIGMGVDSNVLIFERIKEELATARSPRAAVAAGFDRVWITIVDTHVTSLLAAAFLYQFGTSPIRGFATTLTLGLVANVFTAVFASRTLFEMMLWRRGAGAQPLGIAGTAKALTNTTFDFNRWSRHAIVLSLLVIGAGVVVTAARGIPLGIDFSGGTLVIVEFAQQGVAEDDVRGAVAPIPGRRGRAAVRASGRSTVSDPPAPGQDGGPEHQSGGWRSTGHPGAAGRQAAAVPDCEPRARERRHRRGPAVAGNLRHDGVSCGNRDLHRRPISTLLRDRWDRGHDPRRPGDAGVPRCRGTRLDVERDGGSC